MLTLVIGAAASGKSACAERVACSLPGPRVYVATMLPRDAESRARVERHIAQRSRWGFATVEQPFGLAPAPVGPASTVLLDALGTLVANELFEPEGGGPGAALAGVEGLALRCAHLTVVAEEVFSGGASYGEGTLAYLQELASACRSLAARADVVVEVAAGLPDVLKGELPVRFGGFGEGGSRVR